MGSNRMVTEGIAAGAQGIASIIESFATDVRDPNRQAGLTRAQQTAAALQRLYGSSARPLVQAVPAPPPPPRVSTTTWVVGGGVLLLGAAALFLSLGLKR